MSQRFYTGVIRRTVQGDDGALYVTIEITPTRGRARAVEAHTFWAQERTAQLLTSWIAIGERWALNVETTTGEIVGVSRPADGGRR